MRDPDVAQHAPGVLDVLPGDLAEHVFPPAASEATATRAVGRGHEGDYDSHVHAQRFGQTGSLQENGLAAFGTPVGDGQLSRPWLTHGHVKDVSRAPHGWLSFI